MATERCTAQPARRPISQVIAAIFMAMGAMFVLAFLAAGRLPGEDRRNVATSGLTPAHVASVVRANVVGRCRLNASVATWPDWILQGLRTHPDDQARPGMPTQAKPAVAAKKAGDTV